MKVAFDHSKLLCNPIIGVHFYTVVEVQRLASQESQRERCLCNLLLSICHPLFFISLIREL